MKKALTLTITLVICMFTLTYGGKVKEDKARQVAQNWYRHFAPNAKSLAEITHTKEYKWGDRTSFYIYSFDKGGFVLVSANDAVSPILGYGFDHPVPDIITNEAVKAWFDGYARQIDTAFVLNLDAKASASKWSDILNNNFPKASGNSVEPLLTTTWDQGWPYNAMCPEDISGPGGHAVLGCTAVALAQIMKYYNYPDSGVSNYSYYSCNYDTISVNFMDSEYDWANMPNSISALNNEVSEICAHAAISVISQFGPYSTSVIWSPPHNPIVPALISFFDYGYGNLDLLVRNDFIDTTWIDTLKNEINLFRPIFYRGDDGNSGHAWVVDGYDQMSLFHCNWGWGGSYNGYYTMANLTAAGYNFNLDQMVFVGIAPNDGSTINKPTDWGGTKVINSNIGIGKGGILTLLPGAELKFSNNNHMQVWGQLISKGTQSDSIRFTVSDTAMRWSGIKFENGYMFPGYFNENDTTIFDKTIIEYSNQTGVYIHFYNKVKFNGCHFNKNSNLDFTTQLAGGLHIIESDVCIKNSKFTNNTADFGGGISIILTVTNNHIFISNNQFFNNHANYCGGGLKLQVDNSNGIISNNTFSKNSAGRGGGAYLYGTNSTFINNLVAENHANWTGGGLYIDGDPSPTITQNKIINNTGSQGPGAWIRCSNPIFINNTFAENSITFYDYTTAQFINNVFYKHSYFNPPPGITVDPDMFELIDQTCQPIFTNNLIPGGMAGFIGAGAGINYDIINYVNNIETNPFFVDSNNSLYKLQCNSPLINGGISDFQNLNYPLLDFYGNSRVYYDTIDIGIHEFNPSDIVVPENAGSIIGSTEVCQGAINSPYIVQPIISATSYLWTLPNGATGISLTNNITVNFGLEALSGEISVKGLNECGEGELSILFIQVNSIPVQPSAIQGSTFPIIGSSQIYAVDNVEGVYFEWQVPSGTSIVDGQGTHTITVVVGSNTGILKVTPSNACGSGIPESLYFSPVCSSPWIPIPNQQFNMQVIAQIMIDDAVSTNANDIVGAFVGDECRGIASPLEGLGMAFLSVGSNQGSGELVELKIWNSALCEFCDAGPVFTFVNLGEIGTFDNPLQVSCITDVDLNFNFGQGYNWFSQNLALENPHPNVFFEGLGACNNDRLISQSGFSVYQNGNWNGTIVALNPANSYRLKICEAKAFTASAPPAEIAPISLNSGYTWLGYVPQTCLPVNVALANMNPAPTANDRLIGQGSFASYSGSQWLGSLSTLCPGAGYVIKLANPVTLVYPEASAKGKMFNSLEAELNSPTGIKPIKNLQHSMTVLGQLELPGGQYSNNAEDRIYAFANGLCLGMANPMEAENGLIFLSVGENSDEAQQISFKIWLDDEQQLYEANEALTFVPLKGTGVYENPFKFTLGQPVNSENDWFIGEPYPNPFNEETVVPVYLNEPSTLVLKLYNTMGQIVYTTEKSFSTSGKHEFLLKKEQLNNGVYSLSIQILNQKQLLSKSKTLIIN